MALAVPAAALLYVTVMGGGGVASGAVGSTVVQAAQLHQHHKTTMKRLKNDLVQHHSSMIEPVTAALMAAFAATAGFLGAYFWTVNRNPKLKALRENEKYYQETNDGLRRELRRYKSTVSRLRDGPIPTQAEGAGTDDEFIEAIFQVLPPNLAFLRSFKGAAVNFLKENPDVKSTIVEAIKAKAGAAAGKKQEDQQQIETI